MNPIRFFLSAVLLICNSAFADKGNISFPSDEAINHALAQLDFNEPGFNQIGNNHWKFKIIASGSEEQDNKVEIFDPTASPKWQLLKQEGREPSKTQLDKYQKSKEKYKKEGKGQTYADHVKSDSVKFVEQRGELLIYQFIPVIPELNEHIENFAGELSYDPKTNIFNTLSIYSKASFSPMLGVKMDSVKIYFEFIKEQGSVLLKMEMNEMIGTVAFVKTLHDRIHREYSEYRRVN